MYVTTVPNRNSPPAVLLRESFREGDKVRTRTLANLTKWPADKVEALRRVLKGEGAAAARMRIARSLPHGHVAAALGVARKIRLDRLLPRHPARLRQLALALIVARLLDPASKLATARLLDARSASSSLGAVLGLGRVDEDELYGALDWLGKAQPAIEAQLARRHLGADTLVLYDVSSAYLEGRCCELAQYGYSRDHRGDRPQIVFGVICAADGCPVAVEVFAGNTADPATVAAQIVKLKQRFGLARVVVVGDRGMLTAARIAEDLRPAGLDWITSLRAPAIQALASDDGPLQLSLFDERDLVEITAPDYPGERLIVCRNPLLAAERARKREALLVATERELERIAAATGRARNPLRGRDKIGLRLGAVLGRRKVAKHFALTIADDGFTFARIADNIAREAALDGLYVIRTSLPADALDAPATVRAYKSLAQVERAFRCLKSVDLHIRPIHHRLAHRVRAHVFLCLLAYYLEWHMRAALAPILFDDHDKPAAEAQRTSPVAKATVSPAARAKAARKRTDDGLPVHSFRTLLADLATLTRNTMHFDDATVTTMLASPTPLQQRAFSLLGMTPAP